MEWAKKLLASSVGKKVVMAITGVMLLGFLALHLIGNLTLLGGEEMLATYVELLHSAGHGIIVAEIILGSIFLLHIILGATLTFQNWKARPQKYAVSGTRGGKTFASSTMPYSGLLILIFLLIHLSDFTVQNYVNGWSGSELASVVIQAFTATARVAYYVAMVIIVGIHVSHGFWSLFQSLGLSNERVTPTIKRVATAAGIVFAFGFGMLPFVAMSFAR